MHNPNIKQKLRAQDFILQAKSCCPKSYDKLPENYVNVMYDNVAKKELFSPLTRSWIQGGYSEGDINLCNTKLCKITEARPIDQSEFVSTADLT